jgi:hypothetical protein
MAQSPPLSQEPSKRMSRLELERCGFPLIPPKKMLVGSPALADF